MSITAVYVQRLALSISLILLSSVVFGQPQTDITLTTVGKAINDPKDILESSAYLRNKSVVTALGLDEAQLRAITSVLDGTRGQPGVIMLNINRPQKRPAAEIALEIASKTEAIKSDRRQTIQEILLPAQLERLEQLIFQIEVARVGFGEALLNGYLGENAGISEQDKPDLSRALERVTKEYSEEKRLITLRAEKEVLEVLSESQKYSLRTLLGESFEFSDEEKEWKSIPRNRKLRVIPNPKSIFDCIKYLTNPSIMNELGMSAAQTNLILERFPNSTANHEKRSSIERHIEDAVGIRKKERLKQLMYQIEVSRSSLCLAVAIGYLGESLDVNESQRTVLLDIQRQSDDANMKLNDAITNDLLHRLTDVQRESVTRLVGKPFAFNE